MFCNHCGEWNSEGSRYCRACGHDITTALRSERAPVSREIPASPELAVNVFRDGSDLQIERGAQLPSFCIKCGRPAVDFIRKTFAWHSPWLATLAAFGLGTYVGVSYLASKTMTLKLPLCSAHLKRRRLVLKVFVALIVAGFCLLIFGSFLPPDYAVATLGAGVLVIFASLYLWPLAGEVVRATVIRPEYGVFRGAGEEFLERIPMRPRSVG